MELIGNAGKVVKKSIEDYKSLHGFKFDLSVGTYGDIIHHLIIEHGKAHCVESSDSDIIESCIQGVSTMNVMNVVLSAGAEDISESCVSTPEYELDSKVNNSLK
jgi:hypothetical protein